MPSRLNIGVSLGRVEQWHDGIGEFGRRFASTLAERGARLRDEGIHVHLHLSKRWHGLFGDTVTYLDTHDVQRWLHLRREPFALWHILHQFNRFLPPRGTPHLVETVHDLNFLRLKSRTKADAYRRRLAQRLQRRSAVAVISRFVADDLVRELAAPALPLHVIHNGATDLTPLAREPVAGVEPSGYLLHVSRLAPSKNVDALVELATLWREQSFVLAGNASPQMREELAGKVAARGLRNLHLTFDIDEARKAWLYANCRGFLFPSLTEGFGLPPIEAMHFGKPVFLSKLTSLPEVGGDVAFYFDGFEAAAMRDAIERGLASWRADPSLADAARARAAGFSWKACVDRYVDVYRALLTGAAARP